MSTKNTTPKNAPATLGQLAEANKAGEKEYIMSTKNTTPENAPATLGQLAEANKAALVARFDSIKDDALRAAAVHVAEANVRDAGASVAKALALAELTDCKKDAFEANDYKDAVDFADKVFGIGKSAVTQLSAAARRFYRDGACKLDVRGWFSPYALYYLREFTDDALTVLVEAKVISPTTTQDDLKGIAKAYDPKTGKAVPQVQPLPDLFTVIDAKTGKAVSPRYTGVPVEDVYAYAAGAEKAVMDYVHVLTAHEKAVVRVKNKDREKVVKVVLYENSDGTFRAPVTFRAFVADVEKRYRPPKTAEEEAAETEAKIAALLAEVEELRKATTN